MYSPVEVNEVYDVRIISEGKYGDGVAILAGLVIFVKGARIGEEHKIKITEVRFRNARAEIVA